MLTDKKTIIVAVMIATSILFTGCGLLNSSEKTKKIDPPEDVTFVNEDEINMKGEDSLSSGEAEKVANTDQVATDLYLLDKNNYVVPQTLSLPNDEGIAKLSLQYLVKNGPVANILPNGFQAVLPVDTEVMGINIKDGVATVDFSKEFADYKPEEEEKIMQSIVWTLTQFDTIDKVKLQINGHELKEMPANGTLIGDGLTRRIGINLDTTDVVDVTNTKPVTVYYLGENGDDYYYVPVTHRVSSKIENDIEAVVNQLINGPSYSSHLLSGFLPDVALLEQPKVEDGKVMLNFNESILSRLDKENVISQEIIHSLVLSLTEQQGIESVSIMVDGSNEFVNENGEKLSEPVTRPERINVEGF